MALLFQRSMGVPTSNLMSLRWKLSTWLKGKGLHQCLSLFVNDVLMGNKCNPNSYLEGRVQHSVAFHGWSGQCGAHAAQDTWRHHRPVALNLLGRNFTCSSKKLDANRTMQLFSKPESHLLSKLTRLIAPPTTNGHAPPTTVAFLFFENKCRFPLWTLKTACLAASWLETMTFRLTWPN